jgi:hypothetical protein
MPHKATPAPKRIQLSRKKGWRMPPNTIKVTRPGEWGNPYKVSPEQDAATCVAKFREYIEARPEWIAAARIHLKRKDLACWCKIGAPCHADVLLQIANAEPESK